MNTRNLSTQADFAKLKEALQMSLPMQMAADEVWEEHGMLAAIVYMMGA